MVLQAGADPRDVGHDVDAVGPQVVGWADAREQQQVGADSTTSRWARTSSGVSCCT